MSTTKTTTAAAPPRGIQDAVATEFAEQYANTFRYVAIWNRWLQWDGIRWRIEETLDAFDKARALLRQFADRVDAALVGAVVTLARADRLIAATSDQWDTDPWQLGTPKGTIDLHSGELRQPWPHDYITKVTAVAPDRNCPIPLWNAFLRRVTNNDVELERYLQRICGYALTGDTSEDALFFLYGTGANGKSVFINTVAGILGEYAKTAPMETFTVSKSERHPTDLAGLRGARLVTATETEEGRRWDEAKIKMLTGGDRIAARFMRQDFFEYTPQFKLVISGNHRPKISSVDEAIRRRMNLLPFTVKIPEEEQDKELTDELKREWPGILAWMLAGCWMWQHQGLNPPAAVVQATEQYLESEDTLSMWMEECCELGRGLWESSKTLWSSWKLWGESAGEYVGSRKWLSNKLQDRGFRAAKRYGQRGFKGLKVKGYSAFWGSAVDG
jgi:putative DNA primase/helicase